MWLNRSENEYLLIWIARAYLRKYKSTIWPVNTSVSIRSSGSDKLVIQSSNNFSVAWSNSLLHRVPMTSSRLPSRSEDKDHQCHRQPPPPPSSSAAKRDQAMCHWILNHSTVTTNRCKTCFYFSFQHKNKMAQEKKSKDGKVELKRELGLFSAVSIILAVMIGKLQLFLEKFNFCKYFIYLIISHTNTVIIHALHLEYICNLIVNIFNFFCKCYTFRFNEWLNLITRVLCSLLRYVDSSIMFCEAMSLIVIMELHELQHVQTIKTEMYNLSFSLFIDVRSLIIFICICI